MNYIYSPKSHTESSKLLHLKNIQDNRPISIASFKTLDLLQSTQAIFIGNTTEITTNNSSTITISILSLIEGKEYAVKQFFSHLLGDI